MKAQNHVSPKDNKVISVLLAAALLLASLPLSGFIIFLPLALGA